MDSIASCLLPGDKPCPVVNEDAAVQKPPVAKRLGDLVRHPEGDDPNELLETRYLCRGGGLLMPGPTGIGKSTLGMQMSIAWSLALPAFDIRPACPIKSLWIQAENDEGDLAEMRDGIIAGLGLSDSQAEYVNDSVVVAQEDARTGFSFFTGVVRPLLEEHRPDLLWIDPALAYLGGDTLSQKDVGCFLRNYLNPLLHEFRCGGIVLHHTNKPPSGKEKSNWQAGDFAYLGSGSAEWGNWARGVIGIRSIGSNDVFELRVGKRGGRLGWRDEAGSKLYHKHIAHAKEPGRIYWREPDASELPTGVDAAPSAESVVLSLVPESGTVPKQSLLARMGVRDVGINKARDIIKDLVAKGRLFEHPKPRKGNKAAIHLSRSSEAPQFSDPVVTVVTPGKAEAVKTVNSSDR